MIYTGTYLRSLDNKLRVLLPKRLRQGLADGVELFLTPGTDQCLQLHTTDSLNDLAKEAQRTQTGSSNLKSFSRLFYARACHCDIDGQGRIRVPRELADYANLDKELVLVGVGFHWEVWDLERWNEYLQGHHESFDQIVQATFDSAPTQQPAVDREASQSAENIAHKPR